MADILDDRIAESRRRAARGEAEDADWFLLVQDRQCGKLDRILDTLGTLMDDRHRWVVAWRIGFSALALAGFGLGLGRAFGIW